MPAVRPRRAEAIRQLVLRQVTLAGCGPGQAGNEYPIAVLSTTATVRYISHTPVTVWKKPIAQTAAGPTCRATNSSAR